MAGVNARAKSGAKTFRVVVIALASVYFLLPLVSLADFSVRFPLTGKVDANAWLALIAPDDSGRLDLLREGLFNSLVMAVMTVVLAIGILLPTMMLVRLRLPKLSRIVEFICLLPLTIPAVVLVVGLAPIYAVISTKILDANTIWLAFAYVILVLPFVYRSLDAGLRSIDLKTLSETTRSFGGSWWTVLWRVIVPNVRSAIVSACFITIAVVLGEFTFARMLARTNLQTSLFQINLSDGQVAAAVSLLCLGLTTLLLVALDLIVGLGERRRARTLAPVTVED
ncbi:ABC transporter permease [Propioniciclava tarda]|uniref:ABC transporter permease subunit n=1 Tax=Propioniciclava tarda TaxID=433330 RepID=A0A4Q9KI93_PROTD|nr:ABC transporter permease subunit [Propioniciclava tarda]TBT93110.1 ABC transporter permease subunit [Propioniciclava tarda]SMO77819.1 putative spermidine/putrescine transport system permease protein [Propioniciclava tarda]HOA89738.1 ABC transporter permease subunit [Propioniciclava tarda]HQA31961.1 ABC transporter permease subunit [Propioniciclava tarda]HQD61643.1 ABC transporter permease subunit [Propioniciclava tarda]